jgi:hypothetical protein
VDEMLISFMDLGIASFHEPVFSLPTQKDHTQAAIQAMETGFLGFLLSMVSQLPISFQDGWLRSIRLRLLRCDFSCWH